MEDKQLDFNQPLLSVRKFSPTVASEKEDNRKTKNSLRGLPQLPHYRSELKSGPVSNPGAVPFVWERKPGKPKEDTKQQTQNSNRPPVAPKLPPGRSPKVNEQNSDKDFTTASATKSQLRNVTEDMQCVPYVHDKNKNLYNLKETKEDEESSDSGVSEEAYVDALDTLSRTESFFVNCSLSGLSGFDDLDMKPSGRFSTDPQMQEFMMGRFLPAAKAMASETPGYVPKKQPVVREQPRQINKKVIGDNSLLRYGPSFASHYISHQYDDNDGDDDEESDDDCRQGVNFPGVCGLLPRFCSKSSLWLLNSVPAMSVRTPVPRPPANRMQARSSSGCSFSGTENESNSDTSQRKFAGEVQTDANGDKTSLRNQFNSKHWQRQNLNESSPNGPLYGHNTSIYCDESPRSISDEKGVLSIPEETKGCKTYRELLSDHSTKELDLGSPVERTLYVDTIQHVESPRTRFRLSHKQGMEQMPGSGDKDSDIAKSKDQHKLDTADKGAKLLPDTQKSSDFIVVSSVNKSNRKEGMEAIKAFEHDQDVYRNSNMAKNININVNEKEATESLQPEAENLEDSQKKHLQFPVPPPLPKSPSDSWLCRTLPTMSTKNLLQRSYLGTTTNSQNQGLKAQSGDPKWETVVKTTKEQFTPIPET